MDNLIKARLQMVRDQIAGRGISNAALLEAMSKVQREFFVPPHLAEFAYFDTPLPIESGQTISQPYRRTSSTQATAGTTCDRRPSCHPDRRSTAAAESHASHSRR